MSRARTDLSGAYLLPGKVVLPLLQWYEENARTLPWRSEPAPYRVWVSEIMLQQTRVAAVLDYFQRFMAELPTVEALAAVDEDRLMKLWQGLGYYSRARNLRKAARQIMERHGGIFPNTYEDILSLPGVGEYTAGAISSIAFGLPVPAVDGNVLRVSSRLTACPEDITLPDTKSGFREQLRTIMPRRRPGDFNQALMELGATVCLPVGAPLCSRCPLASLCAGLRQGDPQRFPIRAAKPARREESHTVFLIISPQGAAVRRRAEKGLLAGLWEFPCEPGRLTPEQAADRLQHWGIAFEALSPAPASSHIFTHVRWDMTGFAAETAGVRLPESWRWADRRALETEVSIPSAFRRYYAEALKRLN